MKPTHIKIRFVSILLVVLFGQAAIMAQETLYPFSEKGKYGYINKSGKTVLPVQYEYAEKFFESKKYNIKKEEVARNFILQIT